MDRLSDLLLESPAACARVWLSCAVALRTSSSVVRPGSVALARELKQIGERGDVLERDRPRACAPRSAM